jgi:hypothetical protein
MTADRFERQLPAVLIDLALPAVPDYLDAILSQTARTRQRPGWTFPERWLPMDITAQAPVGIRLLPWRVLGLVALLVLAIAAVLVAVGSSRPRPAPLFGPAANGSIIYERAGDIYVADAAARSEKVLLGGGGEEYAARFSNDGTTIYFGRRLAGSVAIMAADADGRNIRQLATLTPEPSADVAVAPDGGQLAMIQARSGTPALSIVNLAGGGEVRTLDLGSIVPTDFVAWRPPEADELVFLGNPNGDPTDLGLYRIRANDGSGLREVAVQHGETPESNLDLQLLQLSFQGLQLSDDGSQAAFWNWEPMVPGGRSCYVHLLDLVAGVDRRVTYDPAASCELGAAFLPDGRMLMERQDGTGLASLLVASGAPGAAFRLIGPTYPYQTRVGWALSPDRTEVLFVPSTGVSKLIAIATGTTAETQVVLPEIGSWQRLAP